MMPKSKITRIIDLASYRKPETRSVTVLSRFTPTESLSLDAFVEFCQSNGVKVTRASVVRALVLDGLEVFQEMDV